jgi:hypothetical protein
MKPPRRKPHRFERSTCCLEGYHRLHHRLGEATSPANSNTKEGSLPSRPGSKDAEPSEVGCAPLSYGGYRPHVNLVRTRDTSWELLKSPKMSCSRPKKPPRRTQTGATIVDGERATYHLCRPQPASNVSQATPPRRKRHTWHRRRPIHRIVGFHPGSWPGRGETGAQQRLKRMHDAKWHCHYCGGSSQLGISPGPVLIPPPPSRPRLQRAKPATNTGGEENQQERKKRTFGSG